MRLSGSLVLMYVLLLLTLVSLPVWTIARCPLATNCECYSFNGTSVLNIYCHHVQDLEKLTELFKRYPKYDVVNELSLTDCSVTKLSSNSFPNVTIRTFKTDCPFGVIEDGAFGDYRLSELSMKRTVFTELPREICHFNGLLSLTLSGHKLKTFECVFPSLYSLTLSSGHLVNISSDTLANTTKLTNVDLSYNRLISIPEDLFDNARRIKSVILKGNRIQSVQGLFKNLNPEVINLYNNNISSIDNVFHSNMWQLRHLDLSRNPIGTINSSVFAFTPNIRYLDLTSTQQNTVDPELLRSLPLLEEVYLTYNHFQTIPDDFFKGLTNLKFIYLKHSTSAFAENVFVDLPNLQYLELSENKFQTFQECVFRNLPTLNVLNMPYNRLRGIFGGDLEGMPELQLLDLSNNYLVHLTKSSFVKLKKLTSLNLSGGSFYALNSSVQNLENLEDLQLQSGRIKSLGMKEFLGLVNLWKLNISNNDLTSFGSAFRNLTSLKLLNIAANRATNLPRGSLPDNLMLTDLQMADNPWICDCRFHWLIEWISNTSGAYLLDDPVCASPPLLAKKQLRNLVFQDLSNNVQDCPANCTCKCQSVSTGSLASVDCSGKGLFQIPRTLPDDLGVLDVSRNLLYQAPSFESPVFVALEELNLSNNTISAMNVSFPDSLRVLLLEGNNLSRFLPLDLNTDSLTTVTLSNNPWICDCQTVRFYNWLKASRSVINDVDNVQCANGDLRGRIIVNLQEIDLCPEEYHSKDHLLYIIAAVLGSIVTITVLGLVLCCCTLGGKAFLYFCGVGCVKKKDRSQGKMYDGLLLYTTVDRNFALESIAPVLENEHPKFTLYVPCLTSYRDMSSWEGAVNMCSRVIIIVTQDFLCDQSCIELLKSAYISFSDGEFCPIIIQNGVLPAVKDMDMIMRSIFERGTVVKWGERLFWKKVKFLMPETRSASDGSFSVQNTDSETLLP